MTTRRKLGLLFVLALVALPLTRPLVDRADGGALAAMASSLALDFDVYVRAEYELFGVWERYFRPTSGGMVGYHWSLGSALYFAAPAWLAHALSGAGPRSQETFAAFAGAAGLCGAVGIWLLWRMSREQFQVSAWGRWLPIAAVYAGTPVAFYVHGQGLRPHALEFALSAAAAMLIFSPRQLARDHAALGLVLAAALLVRPQAAAWVVFPLWSIGRSLVRKQVREALTRGALIFTPVVVAAFAARCVGRILYPEGATRSLLAALTDVSFTPLEALFSAQHGWFAWSPVALVGLVGMVGYVLASRPELVWPAVIVVLVQVYLNATHFPHHVDAYHYTRHADGGFSFGARRFICLTPLLALGLTHIWERANVPGRRLLGGALVAACLTGSALALHARAHPEVLAELLDAEQFRGLMWDCLIQFPDNLGAWFHRLLRPGAVLVGAAATAVVAAGVAGLVVGLGVGLRAVEPEARWGRLIGAAAATAAVVVMACAALGSRSRAAAAADRPAFEALSIRAAAQTSRIEREILTQRLERRLHAGDDAKAAQLRAELRALPPPR